MAAKPKLTVALRKSKFSKFLFNFWSTIHAFFSLIVFLKVDYEHNTATGLPKTERERERRKQRQREREGEHGGREREHTFLTVTRLVMKHTVLNHAL